MALQRKGWGRTNPEKKITNRYQVSYSGKQKKPYDSGLVPGFIGNGQLLTPFLSSCCNHTTTAGRRHPLPEPMLVSLFPVGWLKSALHKFSGLRVQK
jgi:hypothetical protein